MMNGAMNKTRRITPATLGMRGALDLTEWISAMNMQVVITLKGLYVDALGRKQMRQPDEWTLKSEIENKFARYLARNSGGWVAYFGFIDYGDAYDDYIHAHLLLKGRKHLAVEAIKAAWPRREVWIDAEPPAYGMARYLADKYRQDLHLLISPRPHGRGSDFHG